jgi:hypothetical protein
LLHGAYVAERPGAFADDAEIDQALQFGSHEAPRLEACNADFRQAKVEVILKELKMGKV